MSYGASAYSEVPYGSLPEAATSDVTVNATTDTLTVTEYAATVTVEANVSATTDTLTVTEFPATVAVEANVNATTDTLSVTEYPATVAVEANISASTDTLSVTEYSATVTVGNDVEVNASTDTLSVTEYSATVTVEANVAATTDVLTVTEYPATVVVVATPTVTASSGEHRLANIRALEQPGFRSIDWQQPLVETPPVSVPDGETPQPLSDLDRELQAELKAQFAREDALAIRQKNDIGQQLERVTDEVSLLQARLEQEQAKRRRDALILLLMAA